MLHFKKDGSQTVAQGTAPIVNNEIKANIHFAAGQIPVNIKISIPIELEYNVELAEGKNLHFGGGVDATNW